MTERGEGTVSERWPDGRVGLTVPEATKLWRRIRRPLISEGVYRGKCKRGQLQAAGVAITDGPRFQTDLDSLLAYFDRDIAEARERIDAALEERRKDLEGQ